MIDITKLTYEDISPALLYSGHFDVRHRAELLEATHAFEGAVADDVADDLQDEWGETDGDYDDEIPRNPDWRAIAEAASRQTTQKIMAALYFLSTKESAVVLDSADAAVEAEVDPS
jgi:hypothetical protein